MPKKRPLRIAINAQILPGGELGGVEQFTAGLVHGLGQLQDGPEEYVIVGHWRHPQWLAWSRGPNQQLVSGPRWDFGYLGKRIARRLPGSIQTVAALGWRAVRRAVRPSYGGWAPEVPDSGGFFERLGVDLVHFPYQNFTRCTLPAVYTPHDLQHLHHPEFFTVEQIRWRQNLYTYGCRSASAVVADSKWVRNDIIFHYGIDPRMTYVIYPGPAADFDGAASEESLADVKRRFQLPDCFALYPAQTWPHKNHIRLLEALRLVAVGHGVSLHLVCTGRRNRFWPVIQERIRALRLTRQVHFLGYVKRAQLRALYRLARFVVFPSLFEGAGLPIIEAFAEGTPVACSNVTSLAEYAGDAALLFDPLSAESMSHAMHRMMADHALRSELRERGFLRTRLFSWRQAARTYRSVYRKVAGLKLSEEDAALLNQAYSAAGSA